LSIDTGFGTFGTGMTSALFHRVGTWPCDMEALKMLVIGRASIEAKSFKIQFGY
jgi:hypothetical protein